MKIKGIQLNTAGGMVNKKMNQKSQPAPVPLFFLFFPQCPGI
jgi:hypothetical protein